MIVIRQRDRFFTSSSVDVIAAHELLVPGFELVEDVFHFAENSNGVQLALSVVRWIGMALLMVTLRVVNVMLTVGVVLLLIVECIFSFVFFNHHFSSMTILVVTLHSTSAIGRRRSDLQIIAFSLGRSLCSIDNNLI